MHSETANRSTESGDSGSEISLGRVILGVTASDSHVVANQLIAFQLRHLGYEVINLGACTPVSEFIDCAVDNPGVLAVVIGSINGHAVEDLAPLRHFRDRGLPVCPVVVGGNLSVGSAKDGREGDALYALGVDHVLSDIDQLVALLVELRSLEGSPPSELVSISAQGC